MREMNPVGMARGGAAKFFMDGVIESYTALLLDDYEGRPGYRGDANFSAEHFTRMATEADRLGLQIFVHAIGDAAVRRTLDGFEAAQRTNGRRDSRHRVEHSELIHPDDLPRFKELSVIASMQPLHAPLTATGADVWPVRVGASRWDRSFAWRSLRAAGATLAFGSDWPVVSQNPMRRRWR
jgi:predicted amidohydrolase YtcJ